MKVLPKTPGAWLRLGLSLLVLAVVAHRFHAVPVLRGLLYAKQEGDILFQSLPHGDLVDAIEGVSNSPWSHCGILMKKDGRWVVVEAIGHVRETPLKDWIVRGRAGDFQGYRVKVLSPEQVARLRMGLSEFMGRPYDYRYAPDDENIYCSELVFKAYNAALHFQVGSWERLGDLRWQPHEAFIRSIENGALPLDRLMITPVALTRSPLVEQVYPRR